jgi:hypothetical protein
MTNTPNYHPSFTHTINSNTSLKRVTNRAGDVDTMLLMRQNLSPQELHAVMGRIKEQRTHSFKGKLDNMRFAFLQEDLDR